MKLLGQGLEDALALKNVDDGILKVVECFVWSNTLFLICHQNS